MSSRVQSGVLCEKGAEVQHGTYVNLKEIIIFAEAPRNVIRTPEHADTLPETFFRDFQRLALSTSEGKDALE